MADEETPTGAGAQITKLHHLRPAAGSKKKRIRVGRGEAGRRGKTAGRGTKGQKARTQTRIGFEGGQMPMARRIPKAKGFKNPFRVTYNVVNLDVLAQFPANSDVTPELLKERGLVHHKGLVKILGDGELTHALNVTADAFSKSAAERICAVGGSVHVVARDEAQVAAPQEPQPDAVPPADEAAPSESAEGESETSGD